MQIGSLLQTAQGIVLFIIIIGILVVVHELGHYLAARRFGVEAPEFGIGFPPRLWTFWKTNGALEFKIAKLLFPKNLFCPKRFATARGWRIKPKRKTAKKF